MKQPLRIAILVTPFTLGAKWGAHAPELARELLGAGHTVRGFGAPPGAIPRSGDDPVDAGNALNDEVIGLESFAPDAILAYDCLSPSAWLGARTARRLHVPLVLVESAMRGRQRFRTRVAQAVGRRFFARTVRRTASAVIALDSVAHEHALKSGFAPRIVTTLPAGVDLSRYRPGLSSGLLLRHHVRGRIVLYVGRIDDDRGVEVLARAFGETVGQRNDWSLVLAGEGAARAQLRALMDRSGFASRVHWVGAPREEELPGLLSASTLLAVPALDDSVRGLNIARAMACGLPILVSDRPSLASLVQDDVQGLVVPAGDVRAWTEALRRASMSPDARRRWGEAARRTAEERYAWPRVAATIEDILLAARQTHPVSLEGDVRAIAG